MIDNMMYSFIIGILGILATVLGFCLGKVILDPAYDD